MPLAVGSRKPSAALIAIAASTAEPPFFRISMPASVPSGCEEAAAPLRPNTSERVRSSRPTGRSPARDAD
jgi:hypothetical protein